MKLLKYYIALIITCLILTNFSVAQSTKNSNTKKGNFEKQTFAEKKDDGIKQLPPPPDGGGWASPIGGGIYLLIAGSIAFWGRKIHSEIKRE